MQQERLVKPDVRSVRMTVLAPGESHDHSRYENRSGADAQLPQNFSHFRQVERIYKTRNSPVDMTNVVSLSTLSTNPLAREIELFPFSPTFAASPNTKGYSFNGIDGLILLPNCLSEEKQKELTADCFLKWFKWPNESSLDAHYEMPQKEGIYDLFLKNYPSIDQDKSCKINKKDQKKSSIVVSEQLIRQIRWFSLGYPYDWTSKEYRMTADQNHAGMADPESNLARIIFPPDLSETARDIASLCGFSTFIPQAGIINYYQEKDTLMGHVDRSEPNMKAPLISISLGNSCIFLWGGLTREDPVIPFELSSGDVVVFWGASRLCYHGVPRIIENTSPAWLYALTSEEKVDSYPLRLLQNARININIRQVL